eukprot:1144328-Pelagomonas_calceolata.AAC.6
MPAEQETGQHGLPSATPTLKLGMLAKQKILSGNLCLGGWAVQWAMLSGTCSMYGSQKKLTCLGNQPGHPTATECNLMLWALSAHSSLLLSPGPGSGLADKIQCTHAQQAGCMQQSSSRMHTAMHAAMRTAMHAAMHIAMHAATHPASKSHMARDQPQTRKIALMKATKHFSDLRADH